MLKSELAFSKEFQEAYPFLFKVPSNKNAARTARIHFWSHKVEMLL